MLKAAFAGVTHLLTGGVTRYSDASVFTGTRIYFANHTSHLDFLAIWAALPPAQRVRTSPVAARDYWEKNGLRRYLARRVFSACLIERQHIDREHHPVETMSTVLSQGRSLILFPEGTRSTDGRMESFKGGLYHLARKHPDIDLVPVCLRNLNRVMPKGEVLPIPLICSVRFGRPLRLHEGEAQADFLARAEQAVKELDPHV